MEIFCVSSGLLLSHFLRSRRLRNKAFCFFFFLLGAKRMGPGRIRNPVQSAVWWVKKQPPKVKAFLAVIAGIAILVFLRLVVRDHDNLFVAAEAIHAIGICVLIYKLTKEKTCAG